MLDHVFFLVLLGSMRTKIGVFNAHPPAQLAVAVQFVLLALLGYTYGKVVVSHPVQVDITHSTMFAINVLIIVQHAHPPPHALHALLE
jgi:hypothetical protein